MSLSTHKFIEHFDHIFIRFFFKFLVFMWVYIVMIRYIMRELEPSDLVAMTPLTTFLSTWTHEGETLHVHNFSVEIIGH